MTVPMPSPASSPEAPPDPPAPPSAAGPADAADEAAPAHACDVLIADDAGGSRELLAAILRSIAGPLLIREVRNGSDAVALWRDLRPRITLLDIDMPGLDGLSALERIRAVDAKAFVAMVSGSSDIDKVKRALAHGAAGYVIKPYKPQRIVELLQRYGERSGHRLLS